MLPSGLKIWPQDVEDELRADPAVRDAAVLAVPNRRGGARLHAYLIARDRAGADAAALRRVVAVGNRRLAAHQRVGSASWWSDEDFPRTAALKVRRHLLPTPDDGASVETAAEPGPGDPLEEAGAAVERDRARQPLWPYTWGRVFRFLGFPIDALYRVAVTHTLVLGREHLSRLPPRLIVAGTHHGFADLPLIRRGLAERLVVATGAEGVDREGLYAKYGILAFGLYPLRRLSERDSSLRDLVKLMEAGSALLIFPQGTHARSEQERADDPSVRFRSGVSHLAAALEAAVLPFGVAGTEKVVPPFREGFGGRVIAGIPVAITRGPLAIAFGPPLRRGPEETPRAFAARLQQSSYALTREAERAMDSATGRPGARTGSPGADPDGNAPQEAGLTPRPGRA